MLQHEFETQGNWLFRWRSYLPLAMIVLLFYPMLKFKYLGNSEIWDHVWEGVCLAVGLFGLVIRAITIGHTPANTSGRNTTKQVAETLNTKGIYSLVRHPLYLGNFFMMLGVAMFAHNVWAIIVFILLFWIYYERIMFAEEAFLFKKFGTTYSDWALRTNAFFPSWKNYMPSDLPFSLRNVLRREYSGLLGLLLSIFVLEVAGDFVVRHNFELDLHWIIIMSLGLTLWLVLRTLKKKTKILDVEGR